MKFTRSWVVLALVGVALLTALLARSMRQDHTGPPAEPAHTTSKTQSPVPVFVELGSDRCTSCRAMIPVLKTLKEEHPCALEVRFVDVWDNPQEGERFGVTAIPTQVLLDENGQEIARHTGFWSAKSIRNAFASQGHPLRKCDL